MSLFCKDRACYLPSSFKHRKAQRFPRRSADVRWENKSSGLQWVQISVTKIPVSGTPASRRTIRLASQRSSWYFPFSFFVEKRRVVLFPEGRRKFSDHFLSHFIAVLADAGADTGRHISRIRAVLLFHGRQNRLAHAVLRSLSSPNGPDRWPFFSGPENTAARSRQKMSPASRRAGL